MRRRQATAAAVLWAAAACSDGSTPTPPPSGDCPADLDDGVARSELLGTVVWTVLPAATNTCLVQAPDSHFVAVAPGTGAPGRLFVFLPGSGAAPRSYRRIVVEAAAVGWHALGLSYPNDLPVAVRCALAGSDCYADVRLEVLTGLDATPTLRVPRDESIEGRLVRLLQAMATLDPGRGWEDFVDGDAPRWNRISVAGHSQGGGHAFFVAQRTPVLRATAYSSAGDLVPLTATPAPWLSRVWATPPERRFGFTSESDELVSYTGTVAAWTAAGLDAFGPPRSVDGSAPPFGDAHMLTTRASPRNPGATLSPHHAVTVVDAVTPLTDEGEPRFAPVWRRASFPPP